MTQRLHIPLTLADAVAEHFGYGRGPSPLDCEDVRHPMQR